MATIAIPIEQLLGAQSEAGKVVERAARKPLGRIGLTYKLWSAFRILKAVLDKYDELERKLGPLSKADLSQIEGSLARLPISADKLHHAIGRLEVSVQRCPYRNWTPVGAAMMAIRGADQTLLDYIDWLQASLDTQLEQDIQEARAAWGRGDTHAIG